MVETKIALNDQKNDTDVHAALQMSTNANVYGPSPKIYQKMQTALKNIHHYPDLHYVDFKRTLADHLHCSPDQLVLGNGSEHILERIISTFLSQQAVSAIFSQYAFIAIPDLLRQYRVQPNVITAKNYAHDLENMLAAIQPHTRAIFLVNPNNPTGTYFNADVFAAFMQAVPKSVLVVLDEAYYEYMTAKDYPISIRYLTDEKRLIIVRTFSKAYGLAGLRLGYAITTPELARELNRAMLPYPVNSLAIAAASVALHDASHLAHVITQTAGCRDHLLRDLNALGFTSLPAHANFVTIAVGDALQVAIQLRAAKIYIKPLNDYDLPQHIRVTVGTEGQNHRLIAQLRDLRIQTHRRSHR